MFQPDVIIVGGGLIGLTCATSVARTGLRALVITSNEAGAASAASAGILAPSVGVSPEGPHAFATASRDLYPEYVERLFSRTGLRVPLDMSGVLEVALGAQEADSLRTRPGGGDWLDAEALRGMEPGLAHAVGALLHRRDGAIDAPTLLNAVTADARQDRSICLREGRVVRVDVAGVIRLELATGECLIAPALVLAAGAWVSSIDGLPRRLPVLPVRGQLVSFGATPLRHVTMGPRGYLVPRGGRSIVGSTMEIAGYDPQTTKSGEAALRGYADELAPGLGGHELLDHWAGLRPVTPDLLPIIGPEPECPGLLYACGHSRNGVLLAPLTAHVIAEFVSTGETKTDISAYTPERFPR